MDADVAACEATIDRLYAAMNAGDGPGMAACYTEDAIFEDPAFGPLKDGEPQAMWRMLCSRGGAIKVRVVRRSATPAGTGSAHWVADYTFTETGRPVHNDIEASFVFTADGLIVQHKDVFDLRRWGQQALGNATGLLGFTPILSKMIRRKTSESLKNWMIGER